MKLKVRYATKERKWLSETTYQPKSKDAELSPVRIMRSPCGSGAAANRYRYQADFEAPKDAAFHMVVLCAQTSSASGIRNSTRRNCNGTAMCATRRARSSQYTHGGIMDRYNFHYDADCGNSCMVKESGGEYVRYHDIKDTVPVTYDGTPELCRNPASPWLWTASSLSPSTTPKAHLALSGSTGALESGSRFPKATSGHTCLTFHKSRTTQQR